MSGVLCLIMSPLTFIVMFSHVAVTDVCMSISTSSIHYIWQVLGWHNNAEYWDLSQ